MIDTVILVAFATILTLCIKQTPPVVNAMPGSPFRLPEPGWILSIIGGVTCAVLMVGA